LASKNGRNRIIQKGTADKERGSVPRFIINSEELKN